MLARTFLLLALSISISRAADKITVYNAVDGEESALGKAVIAALSPRVSITEIPKNDDYTDPKVTAGSLPGVARAPDGEFIGGKVTVAYLVTDQGRAAEAVVLKSTDERLTSFALAAMEAWRFVPAALKGKPIATMAAQEFEFESAPTEFVTQILESTGGKIERPKDWFYSEGGAKNSYLWTISKEDLTKEKRYLTGVRIQLITGIKKETGKTPEQFIRDFVEKKKEEADKILDACEPKEQYLFTRMCLKAEEGPFRILYSLFWGQDDLDMAVIVIAGTPKELWEVYAPTFDKMSEFELIDMKRFGK